MTPYQQVGERLERFASEDLSVLSLAAKVMGYLLVCAVGFDAVCAIVERL